MAGATLTIAALAFIAGTLGAWLVYTDLRDSKRRFEARQRLGLPRLSMFGDFPHVPAEAKWTGRPNSLPGGEEATESADQSVTHNYSGSKRAARGRL
jgi:hypothetical protein